MARTATLAALLRALRGATGSGGPGLAEHLRSVPRLVRSTWHGEYTGVSRGRLFSLLLGMLYVVSPVDVVPELVLPLVGLADDALVLAWLVSAVVGETGSFLDWERSGDERGHRRSGAAGGAPADVVPGEVLP